MPRFSPDWRKSTRHQFILIVQPGRDAMDRADKGIAPAPHHAQPDAWRPRDMRPCDGHS
jgi:hypothetical protein